MNFIHSEIHLHKVQGTYRRLRLTKGLIDFSSNDYLGLSKSENIRRKLIDSLTSNISLGATASRLITGHTPIHERVESYIAKTFNCQSALLFNCGYMANLSIITSLSSLNAEFFPDELIHASLIDAIKLSASNKYIFKHNDLNHLKNLLKKSSARLKVIITESVFSMDGDLAPLNDLIQLANQYNALIILDEAHATGVFGERGLGRIENLKGLQDSVISIHTGGKALGGQGAFILSNQAFRELLINRARPFIFTTGLSPLSALQIEFAISELLVKRLCREKIWAHINIFAGSDPVRPDHRQSQIIPFILGSNEKVIRAQNLLEKRGFDLRAIRHPTVPLGKERLRITLKSFHSESEILSLIKSLEGIRSL